MLVASWWKSSHTEVAVSIAKHRSGHISWKVIILWEEMGKCTTVAAGGKDSSALRNIYRDNVGKVLLPAEVPVDLLESTGRFE